MNGRALILSLVVAVTLLTAPRAEAADPALAKATIVIFNSNISESAALAKFYAQKRGIPRDHLVGLACSTEEEISREDYDRTIAKPLREVFRKRKWWTVSDSADGETRVTANSIRFVALMKGMPLKIRAAEAYEGDKPREGPIGNRNDASVDSELTVLGRFSREISGALNNLYFKSFRAFMETGDSVQMLVCRLDAPTSATVRRMITDAIETEKTGLWGRAYVDSAQNPAGGLAVGDDWLKEVVQQFRKSGVPVVHDSLPTIFPEGYPMSDCALYYGWYAGGVAGPFVDPAFRFTRGAVAVHIHSFSAATLRDPNAHWVGPLVERGAAATVGNVYEPYLQLTTYLNILNDRLLHGFTFAESAYMATPVLSWMTVMVGDPLYRPYAKWLQLETPDPKKPASDWRMMREFTLKHLDQSPAEFRKLAREAASRAKNAAMIEDIGLREAEEGNWAAATSHFQQARAIYTKRDDILRSVLHEANGWAQQGQPKRGVEVVRSVLRIVSDAATVALFRKVEADLSPPPPALPAATP
ncbi:MAG: TIGR03790 family protein [Chthoniobacterales bacterium]|nr:TIGR03790 family protein [Chthoniobacterales bacterium]